MNRIVVAAGFAASTLAAWPAFGQSGAQVVDGDTLDAGGERVRLFES